MNKLVVLDIDGVLADFEWKLVTVLAEEFDGAALENRNMFRLEDRFARRPDILFRAKQLTADPNFYYDMGTCVGSHAFVWELADNGFPIMFVSSRPQYMISVTRRWLKREFGVYFENSTGIYCGVEDKARFLSDLNQSIEFVVEDNPEQIKSLKEAGLPVITWEQKWNEDCFPRIYLRNSDMRFMLWRLPYIEAEPFWVEEGVENE